MDVLYEMGVSSFHLRGKIRLMTTAFFRDYVGTWSSNESLNRMQSEAAYK